MYPAFYVHCFKFCATISITIMVRNNYNYHCGVQQLELPLWLATIRITIVVCNN